MVDEFSRLEPLARAAVSCSECFRDGRLKRSFVDLAQPRYIGPGYWSSERQVAFVMLNPGAGQEEPRNKDWRGILRAYLDGEASLHDVFSGQRRHMPFWNGGKLMDFIELHGLNVDELALVNVAWCATRENKYPDWMLRDCLKRHTLAWLGELDPDIVILSGTAVHKFQREISARLQKAQVLHSFHYAHRPLDAHKATARAEEIKRVLKGEGPAG